MINRKKVAFDRDPKGKNKKKIKEKTRPGHKLACQQKYEPHCRVQDVLQKSQSTINAKYKTYM